MMKCGNCGHPENEHEEITLKRRVSADVVVKPCLHIDTPMGAICGCKNYEAENVEKKFKNAVRDAILQYDAEFDDIGAEHAADIAWEKYSQ